MNPDTSQRFFETMYLHNKDPWNFTSDPYELNRYGAIISALMGNRYRHAFEPGCSVGVLTERLASICDRVYATDISPTAVSTAKTRCSAFTNVKIDCKPLDESFSIEGIDLLVLSEIGYYFDRDQWRAVAQHLVNSVVGGGTILAAHWLGHSDDHLQNGDSVHEVLHSIDSLNLGFSDRNPGFRLDRWSKL